MGSQRAGHDWVTFTFKGSTAEQWGRDSLFKKKKKSAWAIGYQNKTTLSRLTSEAIPENYGFNMKGKTMKLLEDNIEYFLSNIFFEEKFDTFDYSEAKNLH